MIVDSNVMATSTRVVPFVATTLVVTATWPARSVVPAKRQTSATDASVVPNSMTMTLVSNSPRIAPLPRSRPCRMCDRCCFNQHHLIRHEGKPRAVKPLSDGRQHLVLCYSVRLNSLRKTSERDAMTATFDPRTAPAVTFNARNAEAYEQVMGQWSRRLAPLLIRFGGLADGDRVVDVGCGTGSLTFTLPQI